VPEFAISENCDGRCMVTAPGLIVDDLSREMAEAFVAACLRVQGKASRGAIGAIRTFAGETLSAATLNRLPDEFDSAAVRRA